MVEVSAADVASSEVCQPVDLAMGSLARKLQREKARREAQETRRKAVREAKQKGRPPPRRHKRSRGGIRISTPRVGVTLSMGGGLVRFGCPVCRLVLYVGKGTPHEAGMRQIERHVALCRARKELLDALELAAVAKLEEAELESLLAQEAAT